MLQLNFNKILILGLKHRRILLTPKMLINKVASGNWAGMGKRDLKKLEDARLGTGGFSAQSPRA